MRHNKHEYSAVSSNQVTKWIPIYKPLLYLNYFLKWGRIWALTTWDMKNNDILVSHEIKYPNESQYTNLYFT